MGRSIAPGNLSTHAARAGIARPPRDFDWAISSRVGEQHDDHTVISRAAVDDHVGPMIAVEISDQAIPVRNESHVAQQRIGARVELDGCDGKARSEERRVGKEWRYRWSR